MAYNGKNKYSSDMKNEILEIITQHKYDHISSEQAASELLDLFGVVGQSEQCNHTFQRVERGGEFQGNQCECGEWEDLT